jgi:hypothetical protein
MREAWRHECADDQGGCTSPENAWEDDYENFIPQSAFDGEEYAFLTWEARGTAWDFDVFEDLFTGWTGNGTTTSSIAQSSDNFSGFNDPDSEFSLFNRTFVDDTFEKIKLQLVDFDRSGAITGEDIDMMLAFYYDSQMAQTDQDKAKFDFDGSGTIDEDDAIHLIDVVLMLYLGDANADGVYNSSDLVQVIASGTYEDEEENNSSWSQGDWNFDNDFTSSNLVDSQADGGYEIGYKDAMKPIWLKHITDTSAGGFYFPDWS